MTMRNSEHYPDPTAGRAEKHIQSDEYRNALGRLKRAIKKARLVFKEHGFEAVRPIVLKDIMTGRIFSGPRKD